MPIDPIDMIDDGCVCVSVIAGNKVAGNMLQYCMLQVAGGILKGTIGIGIG